MAGKCLWNFLRSYLYQPRTCSCSANTITHVWTTLIANTAASHGSYDLLRAYTWWRKKVGDRVFDMITYQIVTGLLLADVIAYWHAYCRLSLCPSVYSKTVSNKWIGSAELLNFAPPPLNLWLLAMPLPLSRRESQLLERHEYEWANTRTDFTQDRRKVRYTLGKNIVKQKLAYHAGTWTCDERLWGS